MALVQEMALKIDQGFLGAIIALFTPATDLQTDKQKVCVQGFTMAMENGYRAFGIVGPSVHRLDTAVRTSLLLPAS